MDELANDLAQVEAEFDRRRERITKRRRQRLKQGFLLDVCAETRTSVETLLAWRDRERRAVHARAVATHMTCLSAETRRRLRAYFERRGPAQHPPWIGVFDSC